MSSLNFNGGSLPSTRKIPAVNSSHGKVLYALGLYGSQTARELVIRTGFCGAQERANELKSKFYLPIAKGSKLIQMETGRNVYVTTYSIDWNYISFNDLQDFMCRAKMFYGDLD
ncbi:hypothetical protein AXH23_17500 [Acinetobacter pittii]|uniref:Uncharacterized protein n=1 Tax=Acinetobacter pittii TaxID=48296 RepID=A0A6G6AQK6_ACIPI|nr:hypothetical protein [Acinetobacter pittii]ODL99663.1 hypothetical protein AXH23_17500 [Acinetobacter pittii]QID24182.1 hypothetical protein [Acinetobacter pittii]